MSTSDYNEILPISNSLDAGDEPSSHQEEQPPLPENSGQEAAEPETGAPVSWKLLIAIGILTLLVIGAMSAYGGYRSGMNQRSSLEATQVAGQVQAQFELALQDVEARRYDLAQQRLEWIVQQEPNYPGVTEMLSLILLEQSITATPTVAPTPTLTPTPDMRSVEEKYAQAQQFLAGGDWTNAIDTALQLRKEDPDYSPLEVDRILFVALRYRGVDKIKNSDLEGGTYDLALAERFGPLDAEAQNYRRWADMYVTGVSFWDVDWLRAIQSFSELAITAPYLSDSSGWTSIDRYHQSMVGYADYLGRQDLWCDALEQYEAVLEIAPNLDIDDKVDYAEIECEEIREKEERENRPAPTKASDTPADSTPETEGTPVPTENQNP